MDVLTPSSFPRMNFVFHIRFKYKWLANPFWDVNSFSTVTILPVHTVVHGKPADTTKLGLETGIFKNLGTFFLRFYF